MDEVYDKLEEAALYLERNPELVKSITRFPILPNHSDPQMVLASTTESSAIHRWPSSTRRAIMSAHVGDRGTAPGGQAAPFYRARRQWVRMTPGIPWPNCTRTTRLQLGSTLSNSAHSVCHGLFCDRRQRD